MATIPSNLMMYVFEMLFVCFGLPSILSCLPRCFVIINRFYAIMGYFFLFLALILSFLSFSLSLFLSFSLSVSRVLTTASSAIYLDSCCGMEWLINDDSRFLFAPGTLFCKLNQTYVRMETLMGRVRVCMRACVHAFRYISVFKSQLICYFVYGFSKDGIIVNV